MAKRKDMPFDYKIDALVEQKGEGIAYRAIILGDDRGYEKRAVLYTYGDRWTPAYKNQPLVTIEDHDTDFEITIHKPNKERTKFTLSISDFADMRVLMETMSKLNSVEFFGKHRIVKPRTTRRLKLKK